MDKKNMFSLEGKIALVTGGAHGIGFAIAESYASGERHACKLCTLAGNFPAMPRAPSQRELSKPIGFDRGSSFQNSPVKK